jgi:5-(carboxyamino)imidazole ribonucleotide synthase
LEVVLAIPKVFVHLYGKKLTVPGRKMGHVTVLGADIPELMKTAAIIKQTLTIIS